MKLKGIYLWGCYLWFSDFQDRRGRRIDITDVRVLHSGRTLAAWEAEEAEDQFSMA